MTTCPCRCHDSLYAACSIEGGCGSVGCSYLSDSPLDLVRGALGPVAGEPDGPAGDDPEAKHDRRCARRARCANWTWERPNEQDRGERVGKLLTCPRGLCDGCTEHVRQAVIHLPGDVVELTMLLGRTDMVAETQVSGSSDLIVPIRVGVDALRTEIDDEVQFWAEVLADHLGREWDTEEARRSRQAVRVQRAAHLIALSVPALVALEPVERSVWTADGMPLLDEDDVQDVELVDGLAGALRLLDLHGRAYATAGRTKLVHRLPVPCPWCDHMTLVRENGAAEVSCERGGCRGADGIPERHYSWFVKVTVEEEQRRMAEQAEAAA